MDDFEKMNHEESKPQSLLVAHIHHNSYSPYNAMDYFRLKFFVFNFFFSNEFFTIRSVFSSTRIFKILSVKRKRSFAENLFLIRLIEEKKTKLIVYTIIPINKSYLWKEFAEKRKKTTKKTIKLFSSLFFFKWRKNSYFFDDLQNYEKFQFLST